ncbi:MAG: phosphoglycerate dehydrogenase [Acidimicrobiia bacterium]|nr:phosphoglycerate dehydrogenase [Acidimicrobiia bacterium]
MAIGLVQKEEESLGHKVAVVSRSFGSTSNEPWEILHEQNCSVVRVDESLDDTALVDGIRDAEAIIIGGHPLTGSVIRSCPRLRVISMNGVGVDHIDIEAATAQSVVVTNCPGTNANGVAELTIALMLAVARPIVSGNRALQSGQWGHFPGIEIAGKTLGVIGMGAIGSTVTRLASCLSMNVLVCDPHVVPSAIEAAGAVQAGFEELLTSADFVSLHVPLSGTTAGIISAEALALMKPTAFLINTARGELVDEAALANALHAGRLAGAGLDVFTEEPPRHSDLIGLSNVVGTPHMGSHSIESTTRASVMAAHNTVLALKGEPPLSTVTWTDSNGSQRARTTGGV